LGAAGEGRFRREIIENGGRKNIKEEEAWRRRGLPAPPPGCACGWASPRAAATRAEQHEPEVCSLASFAEDDGDNAELVLRGERRAIGGGRAQERIGEDENTRDWRAGG
jgi:hypothetical protein